MPKITNFADWVDTSIEEIEDAVVEANRRLMEEAIRHTPVFTGNLRYNWFASLGSDSNQVVKYGGNDNTKGKDKYARANTGKAVPNMSPAGVMALNRAEPVIEQSAQNIFYISNDVGYWKDIIEGAPNWSPQFTDTMIFSSLLAQYEDWFHNALQGI